MISFTPLNAFSPSKKFTSYDHFSNSKEFITESNEFNSSKVFAGRMPVNIHIDEKNEPEILQGMKIGIGVTVGVVVAAALKAFIYIA